jgi:hypothetical protein
MGMKTKSDRDDVRSQIAAGGWEVAYGSVVDEWTVASGVMGSVIPGGIAAWVKVQISLQLQKFNQSLKDIAGGTADRAISLIEKAIKDRSTGEWDINGLGVKVGIATYHRWWKIPPFGGWNKLPPNYQPYVGFRVQRTLFAGDTTAETAETAEIAPVLSLLEIGPTPFPDEPPPSPIGTNEDINLGMTKEELNLDPVNG